MDHVAYVIAIPQATTAHQATDCRYYRRYNFESVQMLDHEIRDVMNRNTHPRISVSARFVEYPRANDDGHSGALVVNITNDSDILARYVGLTVDAPIRFNKRLIAYDDLVLRTGPDGASYKLSFSNHNGPPLFPHATINARFQFRFFSRMGHEPNHQATYFRFILFADTMPKLERTFSYADILSKQDSPDPPPQTAP